MKINGTPYRTIWQDAGGVVQVIDQRWLPHELRVVPLRTRAEFATAIRDMWVRGAPLIGATAAWGVAGVAFGWPLLTGLRRSGKVG